MADYSYVAITNIPKDFHAADLRVHFSAFVESSSFLCFHYRHRPEKNQHVSNGSPSNLDQQSVGRSTPALKRCCVIKIRKTRVSDFIQKYNNEPWTDVSSEYFEDRCQISTLQFSVQGENAVAEHESPDDVIKEEKLLSMAEMKPPELMPNGNVGTPTLIFLDFIQRCLLPDRLVHTLKLKFPKTDGRRLYSNVGFTYTKKKSESKSWSSKNLESESATSVKEKFSNSNLPKDWDKTTDTKIISSNQQAHSEMDQLELRNTSSVCDEVMSKIKGLNPADVDSNVSILTKKEIKRLKKQQRKERKVLMNENIEEHLIEVERRYHNDNDAEEWDRHEATEDDPSNQERNKERLYEEEIEQPWEKGGPGVVFYTDAIYWQAKEGDFDEQTTDDLDVDFSPYEGDGPGDKDIRDFLKIRQEQRYRSGYDKTDRFSIGIGRKLYSQNDDDPSPSSTSRKPEVLFKIPKARRIGEFDIHTKGFGRKIMEKQGWTDGKGLGKRQSGIKLALTGDGQRPQIKKGLGYIQPDTITYGLHNVKKRKRDPHHRISTAIDNPHDTDPKEMLLQRREPTTLKHRESVIDKFK